MISTGECRGSVREELREATASVRAELDGIAETQLGQGAEGYGRFLAGLGAVIIPLEKRLELSGIGNVLPDWNLRARRFDLKADLREMAQPCDFLEMPLFRAPAELLGAAYVLESSRLDAALLLRTIGQSKATRFLRHGQGKGLWPRFLYLFEASSEVREHLEQTKATAMEVFRLFIRAMNSAAHASAFDAAG